METIVIKKKKNEKGQKMINNYILLDTIGEGSFAKVKLAEKDDKLYAIKIMKKSFLTSQKLYYMDSGGCNIYIIPINNSNLNFLKSIKIKILKNILKIWFFI